MKKTYQTSDGEVFKNKELAFKHEKMLENQSELKEIHKTLKEILSSSEKLMSDLHDVAQRLWALEDVIFGKNGIKD